MEEHIMRPLRLRFGFLVIALLAIAIATPAASAADAFYVMPLAKFKLTEGTMPNEWEIEPATDFWWNRPQARCRVVVDGAGEAYAVYPGGALTKSFGVDVAEATFYRTLQFAARAPEGKAMSGRIYIPKLINKSPKIEYVAVRFVVDPSQAKAESARDFYACKTAYFDQLLANDLPGAAYFRAQADAAARELGDVRRTARNDSRRFSSRRASFNDLGDTFSLATGGRAIAENLQLDRVLPPGEPQVANVELSSISGITVKEFKWDSYIKDKQPTLDPLAEMIPADQHAVFFATFDALIRIADHVDRYGTPVLRAAEPRSEDAETRRRYEKQLCLPTSTLSRMLGPQVIRSVALTGGDPYLRTGSDVAVLFEAKQKAVLTSLITARVAMAGKEYASATKASGEIDGVAYTGMRSPDRVVCSYVATLGDAVVVTNSLTQLRRLVDTHKKRIASLATLPEYKFFRDRYPRGAADEHGLLILSDATIRRWCGPAVRIGDSRRVRAAAVMSDLQARNLKHVAERVDKTLTLASDYPLIAPGQLEIAPTGVTSTAYGDLGFMTPIDELDVQRVTAQERDFYQRWRDGYQNNWSNFFDPIAVKFYVGPEKLAADLTVMPLINASQYNDLRRYIGKAKLREDAGDPHDEAILHWTLAFDENSDAVKSDAMMLSQWAPGLKANPFAWIDSSLSVYIDQDPLWEEMSKREENADLLQLAMSDFNRLPVALYCDVKDSFKLAAFLTLVRATVDTSAPDLTKWETRKHRDLSYVRVGAENSPYAIYYFAGRTGFTVSPHEGLIKRAIDRQIVRNEAAKAAAAHAPDDAKAASATTPASAAPLGEHIKFKINPAALGVIDLVFRNDQENIMQQLAWANIPILNEWHHLYPGEDPVALHERLWKRKLVCPGGGEYRWNDKWQTMESTVYGHPAEPKRGPTLAAGLRGLDSGRFGLTFEEEGLRARAELTRSKAAQP
jgi:hypothetical protein